MAAVNGHVEELRQSATPSLHLGKRKRSLSSEQLAIDRADTIQNLVRDLKVHDFASKILLHPATPRSAEIPAAKKLRSDPDQHTIEARLAEESYHNLDDLLLDLKHAATQLSSDTSSTAPATTDDRLSKSQSVQLEQLITRYSDTKSSATPKPSSTATTQLSSSMLDNRNQVLSVRSSVEGGAIRQLFTGLRIQPAATSNLQEIDATKLPNGFDVIEAATLHPSRKPRPAEKRTFGAVFGQQRNLRQLEAPKYSRGVRGNRLDFEKPYENLAISNKQDYRHAQLNAGLSLSYATTKQDIGKPPASRDIAASLSSDALFTAAYSSFAPSHDREYAIVPQSDKSRRYWRRYGADAWASKSTHSNAAVGTHVNYPDPDLQDFDAVIADYVAPDPEEERSRAFMTDEASDSTASKEVDEIMEEVAELLQTLSSYQKIRDLDRNAVNGAVVKPTSTEQETFELLRSQLKLLIDSLPPFAVAKLDGSQLNALSVSRSIHVDPPDVAGTGQLDEYTLRRTRAHVQQQPSRSNAQPPMQTRPYASAQTPSTGYNAQTRPTYNANTSTPSVPGYASRGPNAGFYNTPRPNPTPAYNGQTTTFRQQPPYPNATIQQYQRSLQNGYAQSIATSQSYTQRPNSYLSNLQGQSATPSKPPVMNGATFAASSQQAVRPPYSPSTATNAWTGASAQATIKAQQQLQQQREQAQVHANSNATETQRQTSNTPQPDGSVDDNTIHVATNGKTATPAPVPASASTTPAPTAAAATAPT